MQIIGLIVVYLWGIILTIGTFWFVGAIIYIAYLELKEKMRNEIYKIIEEKKCA